MSATLSPVATHSNNAAVASGASHKRVCMIAYSEFSGDTRVMQYANALAARGDDVEIVSLSDPEPAVASQHSLRITVHDVQKRERDESSVFDYAFRTLRFLFNASRMVIRLNREHRFDLIHVHSIPDFLVFAALEPKLGGVPVILDIHDIMPELYASKFPSGKNSWMVNVLLWLERVSVRFADHIIVANEIWRERIATRCRTERKCTTIGNFPDPELFYPRRRSDNGQRFTILYPGSLNPHQGVDIAIRAFARVADQLRDAEFHIYGDGPAKLRLKELVGKLGLEGRVILHPFVPVSQIAEVMANADLAVVPKRADSFGNEAASTKVLEFMSLGVPVVLTRTTIDTQLFDESLVTFFESDNEGDLALSLIHI